MQSSNQSTMLKLTHKDIVPTNAVSKFWYSFVSMVLRATQRNIIEDPGVLSRLYNGVLHLNSLSEEASRDVAVQLAKHVTPSMYTIGYVTSLLRCNTEDVMCISVSNICDNCPLNSLPGVSGSSPKALCDWLSTTTYEALQALPKTQQEAVTLMTHHLITELFVYYNLDVT